MYNAKNDDYRYVNSTLDQARAEYAEAKEAWEPLRKARVAELEQERKRGKGRERER